MKTTWPSGPRRLTRNQFPPGSVGSNPAVVVFYFIFLSLYLFLYFLFYIDISIIYLLLYIYFLKKYL